MNLNKIKNYALSGPMANDLQMPEATDHEYWEETGWYPGKNLQRLAKSIGHVVREVNQTPSWNPTKGKYGVFGAAKGSELGTIRRVGKKNWKGERPDGPYERFETHRSEGLEGIPEKTPKNIQSVGEFESDWVDPYKEALDEMTLDIGGEEHETPLVDYDPAILGNVDVDTEIEDIFQEHGMLRETASGLEKIIGDYTTAEHTWEGAKGDWGDAQIEATTERDAAALEWREGRRDLSRQRAEELKGMVDREVELEGQASQSGFAYSGPVERLKATSREGTKTAMELMEEEEIRQKDARDERIFLADKAENKARREYRRAEHAWDTAGLDYEIAAETLIRNSIEAVDKMATEVQDVSGLDRDIHSDYMASTHGTASKMWSRYDNRGVWSDADERMKGLKTGYARLRESGVVERPAPTLS